MKLFILLLSLATFPALAQTFEGKIVYANSYKTKQANITDEQWNEGMGTKQDYYIKKNNYRFDMNGTMLKWQVYNGGENKSYIKLTSSDSLYWEDYGINKDPATRYEKVKEKITVMGVPCEGIIIYTPKTKTTVYYNKKYAFDGSVFKTHAYGNWYYMMSKINAIPLKLIVETDQFILTSTATAVTPQQLEDKMFEIDDKSKLAPAIW